MLIIGRMPNTSRLRVCVFIDLSPMQKSSALFFYYLMWWVMVRVWDVVRVWVRVSVGARVRVGIELVCKGYSQGKFEVRITIRSGWG